MGCARRAIDTFFRSRRLSEEGVGKFFCHFFLFRLRSAGGNVHGRLDVPVADPGLDVLDINTIMDQDTDTGSPEAVQSQVGA